VGLKLGALDVSGLGGTHWGRVEGDRASRESLQALAAQTFKNWGESTVDSLLNARKILGNRTEIWASGGVRSGLDAAKLIALGASQVGYASPALEMALKGNEKLNHWMELQEFELKIAIFCTGSESCLKLMEKPEIWKINEN
jgi:isopentenyl-diphosphate delta-isomerase